MKINKFRALIAPILIIYSLIFTACAGVGSTLLSDVLSGGGQNIGDASSGESDSSGSNAAGSSYESSGSEETTDGSGSGSDSGSDSGTTEASPTAQLPLPFLKSDDTFAYAQDSDDYVPTTGSVTDGGSDTMVVVSTSDVTATAMLNSRWLPTVIARSETTWQSPEFIRNAYAEDDNTLCSTDGVTCCPLNDDGTFECFMATTDSSVTKVYMALIDGDENILTDVSEQTVHGNVLYLGNEPSDAVAAGEDIYTIANGKGIKIADDADGNPRVHGDYRGGYEEFEASGTRLSFDSENSLMGILNSSDGVGLLSVSEGTVSDTGVTATAEGATAYTVVKEVNDMLLFGTEHETTSTANIHNANCALASDSSDDNVCRIKYLSCTDESSAETCDLDSEGQPIQSTKVLALDGGTILGRHYVAVVFNDDGGQVRVRISQYKSSTDYTALNHFGGTTSFSSSTGIKDALIYHKQTSSSSDSHLAILDSENDRVIIGTFNTSSSTESIDGSSYVSVGDNPVAMKQHNNRLYVLNADGQSLSVIRLLRSDDSTPRTLPVVSATVRLAGQITDKTLTFSPNTLAVSNGKLIVGDRTHKAMIVIDPDMITEDSVADDSDSSTATDTSTSTETESSSDTSTESETSTSSESTTSTETATTTETTSSTDTGSSTSSSTTSDTSTSTSSSSSTSSSTESSSSSSSTSTSTSTSTGGRATRR